MVSSGLLTSQQYSYQFITVYGYRDAINRHSKFSITPCTSHLVTCFRFKSYTKKANPFTEFAFTVIYLVVSNIFVLLFSLFF